MSFYNIPGHPEIHGVHIANGAHNFHEETFQFDHGTLGVRITYETKQGSALLIWTSVVEGSGVSPFWWGDFHFKHSHVHEFAFDTPAGVFDPAEAYDDRTNQLVAAPLDQPTFGHLHHHHCDMIHA